MSIECYEFDGWEIKKNFCDVEIFQKNLSRNDIFEKIIFYEKLSKNSCNQISYKIFDSADFFELDSALSINGYKKTEEKIIMNRDISIENFYIKLGSQTLVIDSTHKNFIEKVNTIVANNDLDIDLKNFYLPFRKAFFCNFDMEDNIIAYGICMKKENYLGIFNIYVEEDFRNKGIAYNLINGMIIWGKDCQCKKAFLYVDKSNEMAINLYNKLGFYKAFEYWYRVKEIL